ncbi:3'(2'),5'-bisphosphate nucleotidase CysQ [Elongatibacter sediminis]|uniref:3'(2'),5'-bisphosphate nucleotidase CysQ n=1 Tax=Elongatibacter sediminis TaxID=3119006 RepID=A0AAW9RCF6_9GAMM
MTAAGPGQQALDIAAIAQRAGAAILEVYHRDFEVTHKEDTSPLTEADLASHRLIRDELAALTPDIPLLSEESAEIDFETRSAWNEYWLVDPLDGTKEFVNRNGEFTVNIALIRRHEPVLGVVFVPVTGVTYIGEPGRGAWRYAEGESPQGIAVRQPCPSPAVVVGSRSHANPLLEKHLSGLGGHELVSMGSSLKFCRVAEGEADFYPRLGPTSEWDTAAAHAVVTGAGGAVVTLNGEPLRYNLEDSLLNPEFLVIADTAKDYPALFAGYGDD